VIMHPPSHLRISRASFSSSLLTLSLSLLLLLLGCFKNGVTVTMACTNILVSPGASEDGSTLLAYNADSGALYGRWDDIALAVYATSNGHAQLEHLSSLICSSEQARRLGMTIRWA
jgi:hypothetical protein